MRSLTTGQTPNPTGLPEVFTRTVRVPQDAVMVLLFPEDSRTPYDRVACAVRAVASRLSEVTRLAWVGQINPVEVYDGLQVVSYTDADLREHLLARCDTLEPVVAGFYREVSLEDMAGVALTSLGLFRIPSMPE